MEKEAYIINYIKQPSQLCAKYVYTKKHHIDNKMQCMQINMILNMMMVLKRKTEDQERPSGRWMTAP
jgi:hypothetical protein